MAKQDNKQELRVEGYKDTSGHQVWRVLDQDGNDVVNGLPDKAAADKFVNDQRKAAATARRDDPDAPENLDAPAEGQEQRPI